MGEKIVEPSEIITNIKQGKTQERATPHNPYARLLARFFDYSLWLLILTALRHWMGTAFPKALFGHLIPFEFFAWIPIEACLLSFWGTTPGKFLFGLRLWQGRKEKLDFAGSLERSFRVWFRGLGLGLPGINVFCMFMAMNQLKLLGSTSWDREANITVSYKEVPQWKIIVSGLVIAAGFLLYYTAWL